MADYQLYLGDCTKILETKAVDAIVSDPPYGGNYDFDYTRFSGGLSESRNYCQGVVGDDKPFDPTWLLDYQKVILWGYNHFANSIPIGSLLVWNKRRDNQLGKFLSDGEVGWQNSGHGVYVFNHHWNGFDRASEKGKSIHPTQKPVALMRWCIQRLNIPVGSIICDPYMGSGTTGIAAIQLGYRFVGIEIVPEYFETARNRIADAERRPSLFPYTEAV
jgi:site-specific DNA-methyltransferase (adenine-specific)